MTNKIIKGEVIIIKNFNVLSLFDGISCGRVALDKAGIEPTNYFASEINEESIQVALHNYPDIQQLGDITKLIELDDNGKVARVSDTLKNLPKINIFIGGSPCQGLSRSKTDRENLKDIRSKLFYHYVAIKEWLQVHNNPDLVFLLENVKPNKETQDIMSEKMKVEPLEINSDLFSAQDRLRLYWTNINVDIHNIKNKNLIIKDILDENHNEKIYDLKDNEEYMKTVRFGKNVMSWDTSGKGSYSQQNRARFIDGKMNTLSKSNGGDKTRIYLGDFKYRNASVLELERLQTLPEGYTSCLKSKGARRGIIGDGWTVDVVAYIFSFIEF